MPSTTKGERYIHLSILVAVEKDGKEFHGFAPALKGLHVDGKTLAETLRRASEAISVYLDSLEKAGDPLPVSPYIRVHRHRPNRPRPILRRVNVQWPSRKISGVR
jgi:predicted RNase H-like HicB family nuclease